MADLPAGFRAAGVYCGLKKDPQKNDISLVVSDRDVVAAGVYTKNLICAAPVVVSRERTPAANIRAIITNSGNANACTGDQGLADALAMTRITAEACGVLPEQVLVMSTGVIGMLLNMEKVELGIRSAASQLAANEDALNQAARGIMTTDTTVKIASRSLQVDQREILISGMAKGSGMIAPNMATMLGVIMTDAVLTPATADEALRRITGRTFNCITVDGHTSTNDTVLLLASGRAGGPPLSGEGLASFEQALESLSLQLARAIVDDGEGATHLVEFHVRGCASQQSARRIAKTVANSPLVKTAVAGGDPNWGRIVSAAGYAGVSFDPMGVRLRVCGVPLFAEGTPLVFDESIVSRRMKEDREIQIELDFAEGDAEARVWSCDLTAEYVRINADYRS